MTNLTNFFTRHIATVALTIEISTLSAIIVFLVATTFGAQPHDFA